MTNNLTYTVIPADRIMYDRTTGLFPFSPRLEISPVLVERLHKSIAEVGLIQPIVLRAGTLEGVAGNHRLLAYLKWAKEQGAQDEGGISVPAILVECDEDTAITIALIENELRDNLTDWESLRAILKVTKRKPRVADRVFKVDEETARQLEFWPDQLEKLANKKHDPVDGGSRLTREWLALINNRLAHHPDLRKAFLQQLRKPSWVRARTLARLDVELIEALLQKGIKFEHGRTWNCKPTPDCMGQSKNFDQVNEGLRSNPEELDLQPDGSIPTCCSFLRLIPRYIPQYVSNLGDQGLEIARTAETPRATKTHQLLDRVDAYCVAPDVQDQNSCFNRREAETVAARIQELMSNGLPVSSPSEFKVREAAGEFTWRNPVSEGCPCTPDTCHFQGDSGYGYTLVVQPGGEPLMVCINSQCGKTAQAALVDNEARQRELEKQCYREALQELCQATVCKTLFEGFDDTVRLFTPSLLEKIEHLLVPEWDTKTMFHVVTGWQAEVRRRAADQLGSKDPLALQVTTELRRQYGELCTALKDATVNGLFGRLREIFLAQSRGWERWIACLVLARSWRDSISTIQEIEQNALLIKQET